jgi:tetratricopeptide (TPR) repeat protein
MVAKEHVLRIFVSSTFADLRREREALASVGIPALESQATSRGIHIELVDLRWGLETAGTIDDDLILACFSAIDSCRPFFVGIVGSRRGTVVHDIGQRVSRQHGWTADRSDWSITELEMEYGGLRAPSPASRFFLRADDDDDPSVTRLKERIRSTGVDVVDNYRSIDEFLERFVAELGALIAAAAGGDSAGRMDDGDFWRPVLPPRLAADVVRLPDQFGRLDRAIKADQRRLAIVGPRGCGKTSLMYSWIADASAQEMAVLSYVDPLNQVVAWPDILETLMAQAQDDNLIATKSRPDTAESSFDFDQLVSALPTEDVVTIVIDPVDRVALPGGIDWLPRTLPVHVRLVVTAKSNPPAATLEELRGAGFDLLELGWLSDADRGALVSGLMAQRGRLLRGSARRSVLSSPAAGSPSFLAAAARYLSAHATHADLDEHANRIASLTAPSEVVALDLDRLSGLVPYGDAVAAALVATRSVRGGVGSDDLAEVLSKMLVPAAGSPDVQRALLRYVDQLPNGFLHPRAEAIDAALAATPEALLRSAEVALLVVLQRRLATETPVRRGYLEFVVSRLVARSRTEDAINLLCTPALRDIDEEEWLGSGRHLFLDFAHLTDLLPRTFPTPSLASRVAELEWRLGLEELAIDTQRVTIAMLEAGDSREAAACHKSKLAAWTLAGEAELEAHLDALRVLLEAASPHAADVLIAAAQTLTRLGRFSEALARLDDATRLADHPSVAALAEAERALLYAELGFAHGAIERADRAVRYAALARSYTVTKKTLARRGDLLERLGDHEGAVRDFRRAAGVAMMSGDVRMMMGFLSRVSAARPDSGMHLSALDLDDVLEAERTIFGPGANRRWGETF